MRTMTSIDHFTTSYGKKCLLLAVGAMMVVMLMQKSGNITIDLRIPRDAFQPSKQCHVEPATYIDKFYDYLAKDVFPCKNLVRVGGAPFGKKGGIDGDKYVCFDEEYGLKRDNCHVLSFGINNEWSFDDSMDKSGCKVYAFDPTMKAKAHNRSANIQFYPLGLSNQEATVKIGGKFVQVDTYKNILKMLGLENTPIDYLKMDIEQHEFNFFDDVLTNNPEVMENVRQFGLEIHVGTHKKKSPQIKDNSRFNRMYGYFQRLECMGFKLISVHKNVLAPGAFKYKGELQVCCYEVVFAKKM